jgi:NAD(P)-dependent dehydrogenase (short-subunit alcohol dehydrogenase family)
VIFIHPFIQTRAFPCLVGVMESSPFKHTILQGHVALITGGGSGIGFEITKQLGCHGAKVVISGRRRNVLESACEELRKLGIDAQSVQVCVSSKAV